MDSYVGRKEKQHSVKTILVCGCRKYPPDHHGREGFVRLGEYPSISMFSPDFSSTVKWSSQIMMRSSQRFTGASSRTSGYAGCCLIKSCSSLMRTICASLAAVPTVHFFALLSEFEDLIGNLVADIPAPARKCPSESLLRGCLLHNEKDNVGK